MGGAGGRDGGHYGHLVRPVGYAGVGRRLSRRVRGEAAVTAGCGMGCGNDGSGGTVNGGRPRWRFIE
jgi:hypothetical protein